MKNIVDELKKEQKINLLLFVVLNLLFIFIVKTNFVYMIALNIALIDFPFITLLIIAHKVSNIGSPNTISGNTITAMV